MLYGAQFPPFLWAEAASVRNGPGWAGFGFFWPGTQALQKARPAALTAGLGSRHPASTRKPAGRVMRLDGPKFGTER
jgi:hypothetical protein